MNKIIVLAGIICLLTAQHSCVFKRQSTPATNEATPTADNSRNSLNWEGIYVGKTIACPTCPAETTTISLYPDNTYVFRRTDGENKPDKFYTGTVKWNAEGNDITLSGLPKSEHFPCYKVGENRLFQLDKDGKRLAEQYILPKTESFESK
ncbi:MAG: copper resistance protein NlpE [Prevotellaceae bacterium]|jgi:hypothetical protein|nr:copper resistance protein NlpE [Prevotellaceae bacterium]